jgi:hypothetical protein
MGQSPFDTSNIFKPYSEQKLDRSLKRMREDIETVSGHKLSNAEEDLYDILQVLKI